MKFRSLALASALIVAPLTMTPAFAAPHGVGSFGGQGFSEDAGGRLMRMADKLDLSDTQIADIRALFAAGKEQRHDDRAALAELRSELRATSEAQTFDPETAQVLADQVGELMAALAYRRTAAFADMLQILSPEQKEQLLVWQEQRQERRRGRRRGQ